MDSSLPVIAIIGGTGDLGSGLTHRWVEAGYRVIVGSREESKAVSAAKSHRKALRSRGTGSADVVGMGNFEAASSADIVVLTVPYRHHTSTLEQVQPALHGKILIDATVPLVPPKVGRVQLPGEGSAGQVAQELLGDEVRVVSAFQNVAAHDLQLGESLDCDVLVSGNDKAARAEVIQLVEAAGMRGIHAGLINNAAAAEALTSVIININRQFKCHAGIRITGIDGAE